jgi:hypothetical protein
MKTPRTTLERFRLIEAVSKWEGGMSNSRLRELTGLHTVQVSRLIAAYVQAYPNRLEHDLSAKRYWWRGSESVGSSLDEYLDLVVGLDRQGRAAAPFVHDVRIDFTDLAPSIFAVLNDACSTSKAVQIEYRSMTNPHGLERVIEPHALVHIGRRWHVRAWCQLRERFSDFNLGRICSARHISQPCQRSSSDDDGWTTTAKVAIAPHRKLSPGQAEVVRAELLGGMNGRVIEVRSCLAAYVIQELRAATNPDIQAPPDYQIEVENVEDLKQQLFDGS